MRHLGIDLGSSSIKAVEIDSAFGRYDIHDYHEHPWVAGGTPEDVIAQLIKNLPKPPDRIIVALPEGQSTFRNLTLPTKDKKAIQAGVGFELEDELPFPLEESIFDYAILSQTKQGSVAHVAVTLKRHLTAALEKFQKANLDPDVISTESWAYRTLLNRILGAQVQEAPILLAQIGNEKTILYLHWRGTPVLIREVPWGGKDLTVNISQKYNLPFDQAETAKLDRGLLCSDDPKADVTPEQQDFSQCLEEALRPFLVELKQTELMCKNVTHHSTSAIYLAGGTALLPGLGPWIQTHTKTPTRPLLALSAITPSGVTYSEQTDGRFVLAAALALSQVGAERSQCINFRKGAFRKEARAREFNFTFLRKPLLAVGVVTTCLFLSLIVQTAVYRSELQTLNVQLERSVRSFFGQISTSGLKTYMTNTSLLRSSITKELNKQRELAKLFGPASRSPLDFLNSLSSTIPKDVIVELVQFQAGLPPTESFTGTDQNASASLTFQVANPQTAEKLANLITPKLSSVQRGKMEETASAEAGTKKWKITFSGKPTEESYVK